MTDLFTSNGALVIITRTHIHIYMTPPFHQFQRHLVLHDVRCDLQSLEADNNDDS